MHWTDDGIVLSERPQGESSTVVQLLTRHQGRHAGLVRGGQGRRARHLPARHAGLVRRVGARAWPGTWATTPASWWRATPRAGATLRRRPRESTAR